LAVTVENVQTVLRSIINPDTKIDLISSGSIKNLSVSDNNIQLEVVLGYPAKSQFQAIQDLVIAALKKIADVKNIQVNVSSDIVAHTVQGG